MGSQRFSGVELGSIAKRDSDRQHYELEQQLRRDRAAKKVNGNHAWQYRTPGGRKRGK